MISNSIMQNDRPVFLISRSDISLWRNQFDFLCLRSVLRTLLRTIPIWSSV